MSNLTLNFVLSFVLSFVLGFMLNGAASILYAQEQTATTAQKLLGLWQNTGTLAESIEFTANEMIVYRNGRPIERCAYKVYSECAASKGQPDSTGNFVWVLRGTFTSALHGTPQSTLRGQVPPPPAPQAIGEVSASETATACWEILELSENGLEFGLVDDKRSRARLKERLGEHPSLAEAVRYVRLRPSSVRQPANERTHKQK
jgi:hypothetical protein